MNESVSSTIRLARLLDASFNRAREAARVLEDAARFLLDDAGLTEAAKGLRHRLSAAALALPVAGQFSLHRDTPGDVGTDMTTPAESLRAAPASVVGSAFGRLSEALRSLEEYSKLLDPAAGAAFKQLRYDAYTLHTRLMRRLQPKPALGALRLYVLITADLCRGDWLAVAESALAGGADALQLREKALADGELLRRARALADLCHRHDALFILNDRPDIAVLAGADGVHLGQEDLPIAAARRILGHDAIIGKSTFTLEQALAAAKEGADYIAVGPIFPTATKPQEPVAGLEALRQVASRLNLPPVAIGGITPDNAPAVLAAGAQALAVCQAVIAQPDPKAAAAATKAALVP
jgi:thiamine-phosphate pyrophosphorylase